MAPRVTPERWLKIEELYHAALEHDPNRRAAYLREACAGDERLRQEVETLLNQRASADGFLAEPALAVAAQVLGSSASSELTGRRIGAFHLQALLGRGGMGEVYRARDTKLNRGVAIKVLLPAVANDPDRLARFRREAQVLAALNHPNIAQIYGLEDSDGVRALVMELVEGPTLTERIAKGAIPLAEALRIAKQIAFALEAAHAQGIVHRDLKPANVKVRPDGMVKVLDFGLAKALDPDLSPGAEAMNSPMLTTLAGMTAPGMLLGTAAYMSPEQARGQVVDKRTDIWAFGCVLYEMLTGRPTFSGQTMTDILAAIVEREPDWSVLPGEASPSIRRLLQRCLEKDAAQRLRDIGDASVEIDDVPAAVDRVGPEGRATEPAVSAPRRIVPFRISASSIAGLTLVIAVPILTWFLTRPKPLSSPPTFTQLTDQPGPELYPSLSPDGKSFVYQSRASGKWDIYLQRVGGKNLVNLTKDSSEDNTQPAFSPDGERIAFRSERDSGGIFVMGATGEDVRRLADICYNPAWSPDGKEIVCSTGWFRRPEDSGTSALGKLFRVSVSTGEKRVILGKIEDAIQPHWSPHGYRIAYWGKRGQSQRDIWTVSASGGDPVSVTDDPQVDWNPVWSPDGRYLYFSSDRGGSMNLWRVRIDEESGKTSFAPEPVTTPSPSSGFISFSRDGRQMAYVQQVQTWNLYKAAFDPTREAIIGQPVPVTQGSKEAAFPDVSWDSQWIVFTSRLKPEDVFIVKTDGTGLRQVTDDIYQDRVPRWAPDGKRIVFSSNRSGKWQIWTVKPDGSGLEQLTNAPGGAIGPVLSPDGTRLFCFVNGGAPFMMQIAKAWTEQSPEPLPPATESGATLWAWSWSADGRRLTGPLLRREDGSSIGIAVYDLASHQYQRLTQFGTGGHWLADSRRLLFHQDGKIYLADSESKRMHEVLAVAPHEVVPQFGFSRDSRLIVFTLDATEADVWQMNLGDSAY